jgi:hypothetical protein
MTNQPITYYWAGNAYTGVTTTNYGVYKRWCEKLLASGEPFTCGAAKSPEERSAAIEKWLYTQGVANNG